MQKIGVKTDKINNEIKERREKELQMIDETDENRIKHLKVSPSASFIIAQIGNTVFIKILNQINKVPSKGSRNYQRSIAFLPIYMDEDYCFKQNREKWMSENDINAKDVPAEKSSADEKSDNSKISISLRDFESGRTIDSIDPTLYNDFVNPQTLKK